MEARVLEGLERHARRRREGQSTLSVLQDAGPFEAWARLHGLTLVSAAPDTVYRKVLDAKFAHLRASPLPERALVLERFSQQEPRTRQSLSVVLGLGAEAALSEPWLLAAAVGEFAAVLVDMRAETLDATALRKVVSVCLDCPALPLALVLTPTTIVAILDSERSRERALVADGLVGEVPGTATVGLLPDDPGLTRSLQRLHADGAPAAVVEAWSALALAGEGQARSLAEALLFQLLEARAETAGRFRLNVLQRWNFGPRQAELDLFSDEWQVAIEVDGYHHFRDQDDYRRDRRKDVELQLHGIFVARILANDLVEDVGATFDGLLTVLRRQRGVGQEEQ